MGPFLFVRYYVIHYVASSTVQLVGIPVIPVAHEDILGFFTNVPVEATLLTQLYVQLLAEISVARHLI